MEGGTQNIEGTQNFDQVQAPPQVFIRAPHLGVNRTTTAMAKKLGKRFLSKSATPCEALSVFGIWFCFTQMKTFCHFS